MLLAFGSSITEGVVFVNNKEENEESPKMAWL